MYLSRAFEKHTAHTQIQTLPGEQWGQERASLSDRTQAALLLVKKAVK